MIFGLGNKTKVPTALAGLLKPDEVVLAAAKEAGGGWLAATRYGVWKAPAGHEPMLLRWSLISKAKWQAPILQLIRSEVVGEIAGAELIIDHPAKQYEIAEPGKLTDIIHSRTRSAIISSTHHDLPTGGGWVVVRRVPGQDGAIAQVRLDPGTDPGEAAEWLAPIVTDALAPFTPLD